MILSAGLTPAWQQILVFDAFHPGEVNRAIEAHWCGSGKVLNAGIAVQHLVRVSSVGQVANLPENTQQIGNLLHDALSLTLATVGGPPLAEIDREFHALDVPHRWIETAAATRVCTTLIDRGAGTITELVENGRPLLPAEIEAFRAAYAEEAARAAVVVLIGSLPAGTPLSLYRELVARTPCPMVLDFRGDGLMSVLDLKPHVVKPNREELAQTVGRALDDDGDLCRAMQSLNDRGARWVVVTQGKGPVWLSSLKRVYRLHPLPVGDVSHCGATVPAAVEARRAHHNPIGCGDALAAGIAWGMRKGMEMPDAVRLGVAAAADRLRTLLPSRLDPLRVARRAAEVRIEMM